MSLQWPIALVLTALAAFLCRNRRYRWFYIIAKTYRRDLRAASRFLRFAINFGYWIFREQTVVSLFSSVVKNHPHKVAYYFEDEIWTFTKIEDFSNKVARYFERQGLRKGDNVALLLENRPEYVCIWLGLAKLGVATALINTNLVKDPLIHSVTATKCKALIFGSGHLLSVRDVLPSLTSLKLYQFQEVVKETGEVLTNSTDLRSELEGVSEKPLAQSVEIRNKDPLIYIYTSGTTGLPKAAVITHVRFFLVASGLRFLIGLKFNDVIYDPLPLYHMAGGVLGVGPSLLFGVSVVMKKKFSASNYWKDCQAYKCTIAQYIGEMCRYILIASDQKTVEHPVRAIVGNGLRSGIWNQFVDKFGIKSVYEIYGATEGISNMINVDNMVGSVGFIPKYCRWFYPVALIKCDEATGEPIRDAKGLCIECDVNEAGLLIGKIKSKGIFEFKGYVDHKATNNKILRSVFRDGDMYFNSGDILLADEFGNFFFKDRTGDTFRWKGENVSTVEVETVISKLVNFEGVVVFGVQIPGTEGRAGMAAILDTNNTLNLEELGVQLKINLPAYAIPIFVRILTALPLTGTYKLKKVELQADGYDISKVKDSIYVYSFKESKYIPLTKELYEQIISEKWRV